MSLMPGELWRFLFPELFRLEFWMVDAKNWMPEAPSGAGLYCLLSIMPYYNMAVKSGGLERVRKSFGEWWLGVMCGHSKDAIFMGPGAGKDGDIG